MERGKWEEERDFHIEPRRGGILIGRNINHPPPAPGMGAASFWEMEKVRSMLRTDRMNQKIKRTAR